MGVNMFNKKLKIAMLGHKHIPSRWGGVERVVEELAVRMVQKGHRVVCYSRKGGVENNLSEYRGVEIKNVFTIKKSGIEAVSSSVVADIKAVFGGFDVIHFHAEGPAAMVWLPHLLGIRTVVTIHGLDWAREKWHNGIGSKYIKFGEKMAAKYADEVIVLSRNVQKYFKDTYGRETVYIPNGVNCPNIVEPDIIKKKFNLDKNEYILYLGRLVPEKGLRYLLRAFRKTNTNKKLVIAGGFSNKDSYCNELKKIAADDERIIFTGFAQGKLLEELFSNAYIYTLPSDLEGMPISLLEALSYGNCCLTSDIPECSEVLKGQGVMFEKGNTNDLCDKLQMLCDNEAIVNKYRATAKDYVLSKYNWDDVVDKTLELYVD